MASCYNAGERARMPANKLAPDQAAKVILTRIVEMATDDQGSLWYVRGGSDKIEVVRG